MKVNFLNITNKVHEIKVVGKGLKTYVSYQRLRPTTKLRRIRKNPKFFIRDIKNRSFKKIEIDGKKFNLKKSVKIFYIKDYLTLVKSETNLVLERFERVQRWLEFYIRKNKLPLDIGGNRVPIVKNVLQDSYNRVSYSELVFYLNDIKVETVEDDGEEIVPLDNVDKVKKFSTDFFEKWGVGQVWGERLKDAKILSVWVCYFEKSNAQIYRGDNTRFFIVEHYVFKKDISKRYKIYSEEFRERLLDFVLKHGTVKGRFLNPRRSRVVNRYVIGIIGWYPITEKGESSIFEKGRKFKDANNRRNKTKKRRVSK